MKMGLGFTIDSSVSDDHDFLCMGYTSRRARMSCGHTVTAESLTDWCNRQLDEGKGYFECGNFGCSKRWSFEEVSNLVTVKEARMFNETLFKNVFERTEINSCPGCQNYVKRKDTNNLSVYCPPCSAQKGSRYEFCWQCLKEWKGRAPRSDRCDNEGCTNAALDILRSCKNVEFKDVKGVTGCPSVRACPTCGFVVGHNSERCKNIVCPSCKVEFCFVCLKVTKECLKTSSYFKPCSSGVAPRQTAIPVRNK